MKITKSLVSVAVAGALLIPSIGTASALTVQKAVATNADISQNIVEVGDRRYRPHRPHHRPHRPHHRPHYKYHKHKGISAGEAAAIGVLGLAAGAALANSMQPDYYAPPAYAPPPPAYVPPPSYGAPPAWSPEWYSYCSAKYRSFNPSTGTYTTYSGVQRMCQ
ncbi:BA14K family protein [Rhodobacteraceae bacterium RKSG542]|uniref:BA14K family protein n=1 Tax=Pseudovibrio flavus TaxID=2529854 RepID=UPI0012BCB98B|nr:BA14K family protein [Pseudovibrio flavus]MTI19120.1 BA14K family protein [Pseudovibrio flavus]